MKKSAGNISAWIGRHIVCCITFSWVWCTNGVVVWVKCARLFRKRTSNIYVGDFQRCLWVLRHASTRSDDIDIATPYRCTKPDAVHLCVRYVCSNKIPALFTIWELKYIFRPPPSLFFLNCVQRYCTSWLNLIKYKSQKLRVHYRYCLSLIDRSMVSFLDFRSSFYLVWKGIDGKEFLNSPITAEMDELVHRNKAGNARKTYHYIILFFEFLHEWDNNRLCDIANDANNVSSIRQHQHTTDNIRWPIWIRAQ